MAKKIRFLICVHGSSDFPIDMLRYDCCWPRNESDSYLIQGGAYSEPKDARNVWLLHDADNKHWRPNVDRWKSFGWQVVHYEVLP